MTKVILLTGATDGIGLEAAKRLAALGHHVLMHGRNPTKLADAAEVVRSVAPGVVVETLLADLSSAAEVDALAAAVSEQHERLDVVINNAGVLKVPNPMTEAGLDIRFVVNTLAPVRLTERLLPRLDSSGRIVNLSSAAQSPVDLRSFDGPLQLADMEAYAQSKLAITMWSRHLGAILGDTGPAVIALNPGSLLATKMVRDGLGISGNDIGIGADIIVRAALDDEFVRASGQYFDNDSGAFADPHPDALDDAKVAPVVAAIERAQAKWAEAA
jgi:NAD(P)-dependent dehydrogenase (short-subunit alcohol dehydrogenase family)